jgi:16S rRNA G966 N2-methylase RsmD
MRIIGGRFRGRRLEVPGGATTRPITDRVREAIFSMLGHRLGTPGELPDLAVLDLFAGSGAFGIESLSRGAACCVFVERDRTALRTLRDNLRSLRLQDVTRVIPADAWAMRIPEAPQPRPEGGQRPAGHPPRAPAGYGLAFVDPPYRDARDSIRTIDLLERVGLRLGRDGVVAFRSPVGAPFPAHQLWSLRAEAPRVWGRMQVRLLVRRAAGEAHEDPPNDTSRVARR